MLYEVITDPGAVHVVEKRELGVSLQDLCQPLTGIGQRHHNLVEELCRSRAVDEPMIGAPDALASVTSVSVIAPTPECRTRTLISSFERLWSAVLIASTEPCTSAFV